MMERTCTRRPVAGARSFVAIVACALVAACATPGEDEYRAARKTNTIEGYQDFLARFPSSGHAPDVQRQLNTLLERRRAQDAAAEATRARAAAAKEALERRPADLEKARAAADVLALLRLKADFADVAAALDRRAVKPPPEEEGRLLLVITDLVVSIGNLALPANMGKLSLLRTVHDEKSQLTLAVNHDDIFFARPNAFVYVDTIKLKAKDLDKTYRGVAYYKSNVYLVAPVQ